MPDDATIVVRGAREHNLRNVSLELPRNKLIVFTGVSGSGKSSLAFDTLFAEGQRRYVESLSNYARQFLGQLPKPDVDYIGGLSPAISIQQKSASRNPRSTVGTVTEVSDFFRVMFARVGIGHCPTCQRVIEAQSREQIVGRILLLPEGTKYLVLAPVVRGQKGEFKDFFAEMVKRGFVRARVDGEVVRMTDDLKLDKKIKHNIEVVIDRLQAGSSKTEAGAYRTRLAESVEQALNLADGSIIVATEGDEPDLLLSAKYACAHCQTSFESPSPQLFSFNSPQGMCPECDGLGQRYSFAEELLIPDDTLSLWDGAIPLLGAVKSIGKWRKHLFEGTAKSLELDLKAPWKKLGEGDKRLWLDGSGDAHIVWEWKQRFGKIWKHSGKWEGLIPQFIAQFKKVTAGPKRMQLEKYMRILPCTTCHGERLNPQARNCRVGDRTLTQLSHMPVGDLVPWLEGFEKDLLPLQRQIAGELLKEIRARLGFLLNVGLHYLSLDRSAPTLSGGEAQRIRLAGQIGSGLVGVLYILDEPSIGLHPRDNIRLLNSLLSLRDMGNTVLVVEHDEDTMRAADYLVDFGPGPGIRGGEIVAAGPPAEVLANPNSPTGQYLTGAKSIPIPAERRKGNGKQLRLVDATHNNLKNVTVEIPLGKFVVVTGVSGSGKSSLINDVLRQGLGSSVEALEDDDEEADQTLAPRPSTLIEGRDHIDKVIDIDQTPIGRTPRSNPATYIKVWDEIRNLFAKMNEAKLRGYNASRFSFNTGAGRCEACQGNGSNRLEMDFLSDVWVTCPVCSGKRFNFETLQVKYRGKNIHEVLELEVGQAVTHFESHPKIAPMLRTLHDVGLDYIKLGQPSPTLSGGEAQRVKLAKELCRKGTGKTLYILDEPTTGLHFEDIRKLLEVLHGFVEQGNTVLVIEHNLDVMKTADWIIDLGPDGGSGGGHIVAMGTPETVAKHPTSFTGIALKPVLAGEHLQLVPTKKAKKSTGKNAAGEITHIEVRGASLHNLKSVDVSLPRNKMTVFSGPSGSGKSSLAMDTIYAEGQRRYVESLSSYARQFLGQVQKPKVEQITGLSPAIAIEQKTTSKSPRSTVGTITEVYDYLRILYARLGQRYCPKCQVPIGTQTTDDIIEKITGLPEGTKVYILAPVERRGQEKYESLFDEIRRNGYVRVRIDNKSYNLDELPAIDHRRKHRIEVVVDRNVIRPNTRTRISDAVEQALSLGQGVCSVAIVDQDTEEPKWTVESFSQHLACKSCGTSYEHLNPHHYSFNSPLGWCPTCEGLGFQRGANVELLIGDKALSLRQGVVTAWPVVSGEWLPFAEAIARHGGFTLDTPWQKLSPSQQRVVLQGTGDQWLIADMGLTIAESKTRDKKATKVNSSANRKSTISNQQFQYKGLFPAIDEASRVSFMYRWRLEHLLDEVPCVACKGARLRSDSAATRFQNRTLGELTGLPIGDALKLVQGVKFDKRDQQIIGEVVREIVNRVKFLVDVGLDYLSLDRKGPTLSGGEAQRIRLASQIGSGLTGVLYVLDEPTIGLHPRDNGRLLAALHRLKDLGNTLLIVEHDREVISSADHVVDFGPEAGDQGGQVTGAGTPKALLKMKGSLTGQYLSNTRSIPVPSNRRPSDGPRLGVLGARQHNLRNVDVDIPLRCFVAVTGVSGSGKSSLVNEVLYNTLARKLNRAQTPGAAHDDITGIEQIDKIINVDQDPLGNSPSSNPATYSGAFDLIRELFSKMAESKVRGYHPRRFSFNQKGGRCEACEGNGQKKIEMHFLPDVWVECDVCHGKRYNLETLAVLYKGKSISDVLNLRIREALELFGNIPKIRVILQTLVDVGLGYMALGQPAPTMSGGEAQRVKLAAELARPSTGKTFYLLDEPTTGLHFDDVRKLLDVLHRLVDLGNTVLVVEHNTDVMKTADWIIDLGPEAGINGGEVVCVGTPETVVRCKASHTGQALAGVLKAGPLVERVRFDPKKLLLEKLGDMDLADVGKESKLPWEADGQRWHTQDRITTKGSPCKWDGAALTRVIEQLEKLGLDDVNWNHRSIVEVVGPKKSAGWFLHAMTGHEAYVKLCFRVRRNTFKQDTLTKSLALRPLSDYPGHEGYSRDHRVEVTNERGATQSVVVTLVKEAEADLTPFQFFLMESVKSYLSLATSENIAARVEEAMPWKRDGEAWHLGDKGFLPSKPPKWDKAVLTAFLALIRKVEPKLKITWDVKDAFTVRVPGSNRFWIRVKTKETACVEMWFQTKPGQFNLARWEAVGYDNKLETDRWEGCDTLTLRFKTPDHLNPSVLAPLLKEHLKGFRELHAEA